MATIVSGFLSVATPNIDRLEPFYAALLGIPPTVVIPERYLEFRPPGLRLGIYRSHHPEFKACLGSMSICLQVESLDQVLALPLLGSLTVSESRQDFHGREVDFLDPDGNRVVIHEPSPDFWSLMQMSV